MGVTILQQPGEIVFSGNPVEFKFKSDNVTSIPGQPYMGNLSFVALPNSGNPFQLIYSTYTLDFVFADVPDDSGLQLTSGSEFGSMVEFIANLVAELKSNYYLDRDYKISIDAISFDKVRIESRYNDPDYDLDIDTDASISLTGIQAALPSTDNKNFKVLAELWVRRFDQPEFTLASKGVMLELDANQETFYDISDHLSTALKANGFDSPDLSLTAFTKAEKNICQYYIRYAEAYGDKQTVKKLSSTAVKYASLGGFSKAMINQLAFPGYFISGDIVRFLKQTPASVQIKPAQKDYLYWINFNSVEELGVSVTVTFEDNTEATYVAAAFEDLQKYEKLIIPCGMMQLNVHLQDLVKRPAQYSVKLVSGETVISETKTFLIDYRPQQWIQYYLNRNSLGGYDGRVSFGKKSSEYEMLQENANRAQVGAFRFENGGKVNFSIFSAHKETLTTGYKTKKEIKGWEDFFLSEDKYCLKNGIAYPVALASKSIKEFKDGDTLFALEFELDYQYIDAFFSVDEYPDMLPSLESVIGWLPPISNPDPDNFDDRYYLKTETYNKVQIDNMIASLTTLINNVDSDTADRLAEFLEALNNKSNIDHDHDGRYVTQLEWLEFQSSIVFFGEWEVDVDEEGLYLVGVFVEKDGIIYKSLIDGNLAVPGTDPDSWKQIGNTTTITEFSEDALEGNDDDGYYLPFDGTGIIIEIKYKLTGDTKTYYLTNIEEDSTWTPARRIYGFSNNAPQTITITTI